MWSGRLPDAGDGTLPVQVISDVSPELALKLMHDAFRPATGLQELQPLLDGLPAHLQALAYQACTPSVDTHGEFDVTIVNIEQAAFAADMLPHLSSLMTVKIQIHSPNSRFELGMPNCVFGGRFLNLETALERLMHAASSPQHLKTLHLTVRNSFLDPTLAAALTSELARKPRLEALQIAAGGCPDHGPRGVAHSLARAICEQSRLTRLELRGEGLVDGLAVPLAAHMPKLAALRELHIDDSSLSHAATAAVVRAAGGLPDLTSLYFGGVTCSLHGRIAGQADQRDVCAKELVSTVCMAMQLRALSVYEGSPLASGWCGLGRAVEYQAVCSAQLTRLALVRSVRCEDMFGLGRALTCMPHLRSLNIVASSHDVARRRRDARPCSAALQHLLPGLAAATKLTTLVLAGLDVPEPLDMPEPLAAAFVTALTQLPELQSLVLSDASPSGHTWGPAAGTLAKAVASGDHFHALRDLYLLTWRADQEPVAALAAAVGALCSLTALSFAATHTCRVSPMPALAGGLRRLAGLRRLYLRITNVSKAEIRKLAPALQQLSRLSELRLQFDGLNKGLLWELGMALVVPGVASVAEARARHRSQRLRGDGGPGLINLQVLDVSRCRFLDDAEADLELLTPAVTSLPQLQEVVVGALLRADGPDLASFWSVRVTAESCL